MRLPQQLLESPFFLFSREEELIHALGAAIDQEEAVQIRTLAARGLPPVTSRQALAAMLGLNPGFLWSLANRSHRYYRTFEIPKGRGTRKITAPRVALKVIQKWLGYHFARAVPPLPHVYGFIPGRSHIGAAYAHRDAEWAISVDIASFFQTTPGTLVKVTLNELGYSEESADLLTSLTCYHDFLAQGSPSSPALSNLCFAKTDAALIELAERNGCAITRYADDIVLSGLGSMPATLLGNLHSVFEASPWKLSPEKESIQPIKGRIKIHGLLVRGSHVKLTKGYRNKLRAYKHILATRDERVKDRHILIVHLQYEQHVQIALDKLTKNTNQENLEKFKFPDNPQK